jgi:lipopolysaccharide/colanic/teichoic acid biosynthesis glycosyltransferase
VRDGQKAGNVTKRLFDLVFALAASLLLSPVLLAIAALVAITAGRPVIFSQERIGLHGRPFTIYKFRTMSGRGDAARPRAPVVDDWESYVFSLPGDSERTTRSGRFLRGSGLDELPQLWNILKGDMSLVGPRPEIPDIVAQYPAEFHRRHEVLPGLTGAAQAISRQDMPYAEIIRRDLEYVDHHSVPGDLAILWRTVLATFRGNYQKR